jgi:hypothetical protein
MKRKGIKTVFSWPPCPVFLLILILSFLPNPAVLGVDASSSHLIYLPVILNPTTTPNPGTRLVVFEGFYSPTSLAAGLVVDQLAKEYAGSPILFLEYPVTDPPLSRFSRYLSASVSTIPPMIMIDSGNQVSSGILNYYSVFKNMVDQALTRAPRVGVQATWQRIGNRAHFSVRVTNQSGGDLSLPKNEATVHALVYEETKVGVTSRYVRAASSKSIIPALATGASATFILETGDLTGVDWSKLHYLALVDYQPGGVALLEPYDVLQAAIALPAATR